MRKIIYLVSAIFITIVNVYGVDLSKLKYNREDLKKYYKSKGCSRIDIPLFVKDEIKKLNRLKLKDKELLTIIYSDELFVGTRIAALNVWVKRNNDSILPELYKMKEYFYQFYIKEFAQIPPSSNTLLYGEIERCITLIKISKMTCEEKVKYFLSDKEEDKKDRKDRLFPAVLRNCLSKEGFSSRLKEIYLSLDDKKRSYLLFRIAISKYENAREYFMAALEESSEEVNEMGVISLCVYYSNNCIEELEKIRNKTNKWNVIKDIDEVIDKFTKDSVVFTMHDRVIYEHPYEY